MAEKCFCPPSWRRKTCGVCQDRLLQGKIAIDVIVLNINLLPREVILDFWTRVNDCGVSSHPLFETVTWPNLDDDSRLKHFVKIPEGDESNPIVLSDDE